MSGRSFGSIVGLCRVCLSDVAHDADKSRRPVRSCLLVSLLTSTVNTWHLVTVMGTSKSRLQCRNHSSHSTVYINQSPYIKPSHCISSLKPSLLFLLLHPHHNIPLRLIKRNIPLDLLHTLEWLGVIPSRILDLCFIRRHSVVARIALVGTMRRRVGGREVGLSNG